MRLGARPTEPPVRLPPQGVAEYEHALDAVCSGIRDPVAKLRFIRTSLAHFDEMRRRVGWVPSGALRRTLYVWQALERFRPLLESRHLTAAARRRLRRSLFVGRAIAAVGVVAAAGLVGVLVVGVLVVIPQTSARVGVPAEAPAPSAAVAPSHERGDEGTWTPGIQPAAPAPSGVWLVERGEGFEQYSNGLRIDSSLAVRGVQRRFRAFDEHGMLPEVYSAPVGILFHTSESDIWPLEESFNENLRDSSQRLMRYLGRNEVYNYLIDRFGRVYRVVDDASKVNHAGHSIWGHAGRLYLSLNHAFLGVCFETRWEGGAALPITAAQYAAGKNLSDCLRQRFSIAAEMCVAHGLASVNGRAHLIGHHVDWARGFPFEAYGLPDQYEVPPPSMVFFGFEYDDDFLARVGEPWPGVRVAERRLLAEAARRGETVEELRRQRRALYDGWLREQAQDDEQASPRQAQRDKGRGLQGG